MLLTLLFVCISMFSSSVLKTLSSSSCQYGKENTLSHWTSLCGKKSVYQQPLNFVFLTVDGL